jgi:hypothetical protein
MQELEEILGLTVEPAALQSIATIGETMISNAYRGSNEPRCAWDSSGLELADPDHAEAACKTLLIDIGGTHTKVAIAHATTGFEVLFDEPNESFRSAALPHGSALAQFLDTLFRRVLEHAPLIGKEAEPVRVGIIWSNQITTHSLHTEDLCGITGLISGLHDGGYRKGEWFLDGLRNGHDIGLDFQVALSEAGVKADVLLIGNDTVFTLFATPGSHAGVVVSSGANCTAVGEGVSGKHTIFNTELGGMLLLPDSILSRGDRLFAARRVSTAIALEELCAGAWFRDLCIAHLEAASELPQGAPLVELMEALRSERLSLSNLSLSALLRDRAALPPELDEYHGVAIEMLISIVNSLVYRAGAFAAVLLYLSVYNQIKHASSLVLSLDSSMARHFPGFYDSTSIHLKSLMPREVTYSLNLVRPMKMRNDAEITVPMMGLARALRTYRRPNTKEHPNDTPSLA